MNNKQRQIAAAIQSEDYEVASRLANEIITRLLNSRLTKSQLSALEKIKEEHGEMLNKLLTQAFRKGWARGREGSLPNAMSDVLQAAQTMVSVYRLLNEGMTTSTRNLSNISTKPPQA